MREALASARQHLATAAQAIAILQACGEDCSSQQAVAAEYERRAREVGAAFQSADAGRLAVTR